MKLKIKRFYHLKFWSKHKINWKFAAVQILIFIRKRDIYFKKIKIFIIPIYQISMSSLAPSSYWAFSMILKLNAMRAPDMTSLFGIWGLFAWLWSNDTRKTLWQCDTGLVPGIHGQEMVGTFSAQSGSAHLAPTWT